MAMNGEQVIKIPVQAEIENAQNIVKELQNIASKMKPETRGFREINTLLNQAETRLERIYAQSSRGIVDKRGLNQIERGFQQTLDIIDQAARKVSSINFNSLGLSPDQVKGFNDIAAKINEAEQAYEKLSRIKLDELAKSSEQFSTALAKVGVDLKTDTVESSLNKVESAVKKVSNELETLEAKKRKAETTALVKEEEVQKLERIKDIFSQTANRAEFKEFFASNGNFKAGGKDKLVDLMRMLGFDQATLDKVKQMTASQLKNLQESIDKQVEKLQQRRRNQAANATSNANALGAQISINKDQIQNLSALQQGLQDLKVSPELQNALTQLNTRLTQLEQENEALRASILNSSGAVEGAKRAFGETSGAAENFRAKIRGIAEELDRTATATRNMQSIKNLVVNFLGFNQILNTIRNGIRNAINHIKELDATMNGIAIVTDMTTADLWKQVDAYSSMAQKFGVTIQGAYEVSKIYYQAGYETNEVLTLTNETLKLSKISGLDYATTTDYMMTAMRGFKLEMEDACRVVDVYSNLAANTAVSQQELAEAMTRTASSMESVGATFEETSAMIATMVAVTRESANNIGSAMKSIASRYGELTKDPQKLFDAEGEAMSFNKVDAALKSVGISIQTTEHQFRDFTDVIMELAEVWDTLDSAQQRYIATQFARLSILANLNLLNCGNAR